MQAEKEELLRLYELSEMLKKSAQKLNEATKKIFELKKGGRK